MQMESELSVRPADQADAETIIRFNSAMALETEGKRLDPDTARRGVAAALRQPEHVQYFVAELNGEVVGQCMITYEWSDWRAGMFWWFQSVYVPPEHRGRGVFKRLFEHVRQRARSRPDVCGLRLYVEEHNETAIHTYRRLGMRASGHAVYEIDWSGPDAAPA